MILTIIIIYLLAMVGIGVYAARRVKNDEDYLMGGFKFGIIPMTGTYLATFFSALSLLGGVGLIYRSGIGGSWMPMAWALGSAFGPIIAVRFRRVKVTSPSEFFYHRYNSKGLQLFGAGSSVVALAFNLVVQFSAMGVVWNLATGRPVIEGLVIGTVIALLYTFIGGFYAVVWTDVVQCVVFLVTIGIAVFVVISQVGSVGEIYSAAATIATPPELGADPNQAGSMLKLLGPYVAVSLFFNFLVQGPGTGSRPEYLQRMQAAKNMKTSLNMYKYAWVILIFVYIGLNIVGVGGRVLMPTMAEGLSSDWIMPVIFKEFTHPIVAGLFYAGLLSAAMSTIDSTMIIISSAGTDIVKIVSKKGFTPKQLVAISRGCMLLAGLVVFLMTMKNSQFIVTVAGYGFGILGITFFVPLLFGLYSKRANAKAAWACVLGGGGSFAIYQYLVSAKIFAAGSVAASIPPIGVGVLVGFILMFVVSRVTKPMPEQYWGPYLNRAYQTEQN